MDFQELRPMDNSIYIALSRQLAEFRDMHITANNIANTNTTGYQTEHLLFDSYLTHDINKGVRNKMSFANDIASYRNTETGSMQITGNELDMAIQGDAYFTVDTPLGVRYTRAGNFKVSPTGTLITDEGYPVLDTGGQTINFPEDVTKVEVGENGNLKVNDEDFGSLGIAQFANSQLLERAGNRLYRTDAPSQPAEGVRVLQGMLEGANVKPVLELTHMMDVARSVEGTAKFIEAVYDLERKTSNIWAKQS
jgi:flagellar basal-body rod protein FlgF